MSYYRIIPVVSKEHGIFDTITEVAMATGKKYHEIMLMMGFTCDSDLLRYCSTQTDPRFNKSAFCARRLNDICRELHAPVRIVRPIVDITERSKNEH